MNICIESQTLNHNQRTGLMTYTEGLLNGLFDQDNENRYSLAYYSLHRPLSHMPGPESKNFYKIVLRVPDREFFARQFLIDHCVLPHFLKSHKQRVFHRPAGYTMPSVRGVFNVLTVHDLRTLTIGDNVFRQDVVSLRKALDTADVCVVVSECTKQDLIRYFRMDQRKIKVIYLGVHQRFRLLGVDALDAVKKKYRLDEPFLLSIGSVPRKNIEGIIRAFAASGAHRKYMLVLSCHRDVFKYQRLGEALGIEKRLKFLTSLDDEEIVGLYNACRCFVFPSFYEGFGLPIIEAMRCGAPVITSDVSSCPEIAADAAVLVDPHDTRQLAWAMNRVCGDDALRKDLIEKGFKRAKHFSWDRFAIQMKGVYALA